MSWFKKIFKKEEKDTLDKGLEKSRQGFFEKMTKAVIGKSKVDDEVLDNLEEILIASDVGVATTIKIIGKNRRPRSQRQVYKYCRAGCYPQRRNLGITIGKPSFQHEKYRRKQEAICHNGRWREWCRQDHYHWQARSSV